jgi:predicted TIM-barrel fold metal-dependent hydrolase
MNCIDTHAHIAPDTDFDAIVTSLDAAGVSHVGIMPRGGSEESDVLDFHSRHPDRVVPFYGGSDIQTIFMEGSWTSEEPGMKYFRGYRAEWWDERLAGYLAYLEQELTRAPYKGIGELRIRHYGNGPKMPEKEHDYDFPADSGFMFALADLAARLHIPIAVHMEAECRGEFIRFLGRQARADNLPMLERLLEHNREARIIWAHLGRARPEVLAGMLDRHPNLYTDISDVMPRGRRASRIPRDSLQVFAEYVLKNSIVDDAGKLLPEWKPVFEKHADRIMIATDARSAKGYGPMYLALTDQIRDVLSELSAPAAASIASGTARKVFRI